VRDRVESFRVSFWPLLGYLLLGVSVLGLPAVSMEVAVLWVLAPGTPLEVWLVAVGGAVAVGEVVAALAALAGVWYFRVDVGPEGLRSYDSWYLFREVAWADILSARPRNILGLKSLRLQTAGARAPLWLPPFLADRERFHGLVMRYAGPDHPLAIALHEDVC
jgi:hypothetical protein